ncbi:MAG TPA: hypothetical protein K8V08_03315 [Brevibacterium senegalense]|uniref:Cell division protein FtsL n=1 Tax=Brevibacterium senegalense TaxID=1033736 RepID=A0A921SN10_9MICO|nr:hypothetical protein [Brevibacterium senegalense]
MSAPVRTMPPRAATAPRRSPAVPARRSPRRLRLVLPEPSRPRVSTAVQVLLIVLVGVVVGLVANILVSHTTFKVEELTEQQTALQDQRDRLSEDIAYRESPQNIASFAEENGMKRDTSPQFVDLSTGAVLTPEQVGGADPAEESPVRIPGPRADAREDVRPNLRSPERLPVVGGDAGEFTAPAQTPPGS